MSCAQVDKYDVISIGEASISGIQLGSTEEELLAQLGDYDSLSIFFDPIVDEDTAKRYYYQKSFFDVEQGQVAGFNISDEDHPLNYQQIRVNDSINDIKAIFPKSYEQLSEKEKAASAQTLVIYVGNVQKDITYDVEVHLVISEGLVNHIILWTPL